MNIVGHLYCSGVEGPIALGNIIGDYVKGKAIDQYDEEIRKGISLHRSLDHYADNHDSYKILRKEIHAQLGHYTMVALDIYFDYYLIQDWDKHGWGTYNALVEDFFSLVATYRNDIPEPALFYFDKMKEHQWMYKYASLDGMHEVFMGMHHRVKYDNHFDKAIEIMKQHDNIIQTAFDTYMVDLKKQAFVSNEKL